jgi:hypothetical protein
MDWGGSRPATKGVRVVWQYGLWTAISTLLLKVPEQELTLVIIANTDALSAPYELGAGKLETSPWAREFLDRFVIGSEALPRACQAPLGNAPRLALGSLRRLEGPLRR